MILFGERSVDVKLTSDPLKHCVKHILTKLTLVWFLFGVSSDVDVKFTI